MADPGQPAASASSAAAERSNPLVEAIAGGRAPRAMRLAAARGALPLGRAEIFRLLVTLVREPDEEIRTAARATLEAWPSAEIERIASDPGTGGPILAFLLERTLADAGAGSLLAVILSNRSTPIESVRGSIRDLSSEQIDTLLANQTLLIDNPDLLEEIAANQRATPLQRNRVDEIRRHFLAPATQPRSDLPGAEAVAAPDVEPDAQPFPPAGIDEPAAAIPASVPDAAAPDAEAAEAPGTHATILQRLMSMAVGDKIQVAFKGTREERTILIRDSNKSVQEAVLDSPKLTESEVDAIARMRNVSEEILRRIAMNRDWMKAYSIVLGLATNPKTPLGISLGLIPKLNLRDLKILQTDKNVTDAVRRSAAKTVQARVTNPGSGKRSSH